ncbi:hypothetical protein PTSG_09609 [Salpingoeca rosetta]|uniref:Uncharacterized protein n=1 Tax=Salpingoeca rosetta (strain ATCC 50818 / BSB-021) TaxID=946362 RepID=F2ULH7_SALR5|nr:uncharacterized protein PTSG_09609 [Salpingoeca rosetta]EGD77976.1 hypothetical protein PTSG_09609 [Salpingoeca rosetta]|eukprot:XP_004990038.1 hypothetical protein PTSG_09609 [Salpingoeca rosetta]
MARCALPVLLLNLNCEMLYVIEERLVAQGVDAEKSARVRSDLVTAMFDREFIETLFKPQPMYDQAQLMSMLDHFSQASIIRLNAKSLSKLFDLMIMTVKYQFSLCKCAKEMLAVTLTHLEVVHDTLHLSQSCQQLVEHTINLVKERYGSLSTGTWQRIRHVIGCVLQDKHTRTALQGLNLLARLVGGKKEAKLFPLLLFSAHGGGDDEDDDDDVLDVDDVDANASSDALTLGGTHSVLHVEASTGRQELRDMMKDFDDADDDDDTSGSRRRPRHASDTGAGDDLLAMMDAL